MVRIDPACIYGALNGYLNRGKKASELFLIHLKYHGILGVGRSAPTSCKHS